MNGRGKRFCWGWRTTYEGEHIGARFWLFYEDGRRVYREVGADYERVFAIREWLKRRGFVYAQW